MRTFDLYYRIWISRLKHDNQGIYHDDAQTASLVNDHVTLFSTSNCRKQPNDSLHSLMNLQTMSVTTEASSGMTIAITTTMTVAARTSR